jgi:lysyl-tRNA synthetase class 2
VEAIKEVNGGSLQVKCLDRDGKEQLIDFAAPWPRVQFGELIRQDCGIDILEYYNDAPGLLKAIKDKGIKLEKAEGLGYGNLCDALYKKVSRPNLIQPMFVIKHPVDTKPLARRNDDDPRLADTFQLLVNTWEIVNAYSELVDPLDQRERLVNQASAKAGGDDEAMPMDEDYLLSMEHGMPPMSGFGMGIDRLMALLSQQDNLKDVVLFPLMKPQE